MPRPKNRVPTASTTPKELWTAINITASPELKSTFEELTTLMLNNPLFNVRHPRPMTRKESERAWETWCHTNLTTEIRERAFKISLSVGTEACHKFLKEEFYKVHPECVPNEKQGRPEWYIGAAKLRSLAAGEVLSWLLAAGGSKLRKELSPNPLKRVA